MADSSSDMLVRLADAMFGNNGRGVVARIAVIEAGIGDLREVMRKLESGFSTLEAVFSESRDGLTPEQRRTFLAAALAHLEDADAHLAGGERTAVSSLGKIIGWVGSAAGRAVAQLVQIAILSLILGWLLARGMTLSGG